MYLDPTGSCLLPPLCCLRPARGAKMRPMYLAALVLALGAYPAAAQSTDTTTTSPSSESPSSQPTTPGTTTTTSTATGSTEVATPVNPSPAEANRLDPSAETPLRLQLGASPSTLANPDQFTATVISVAPGVSYNSILQSSSISGRSTTTNSTASGTTTSTTSTLPPTVSSYPTRLGKHTSAGPSSTYPRPLDEMQEDSIF